TLPRRRSGSTRCSSPATSSSAVLRARASWWQIQPSFVAEFRSGPAAGRWTTWLASIARRGIKFTAPTSAGRGETPDTWASCGAGGAFLVRGRVGRARSLGHEREMAARASARLCRPPKITLLGPRDLPRLAILSLNIEGLHHDLVSALLDHLFGIQNRAGCSCAGPYGHRLLGIDRARSERYCVQIANGYLAIKPGWVRISLPSYASAQD